MRQEDRGVAPALPRRARKRLAAVKPLLLIPCVPSRGNENSPWPAEGDWRARGWLNIRTDCGPLEMVRRRYRFDPIGLCPRSRWASRSSPLEADYTER
jgi:hypothetical protein